MNQLVRHCDYPFCTEDATHAVGMLFYCTPHVATAAANRAVLIKQHHDRRRVLQERYGKDPDE